MGMKPTNNPRAWVGVAAQAHVERGVGEGFAQLCHGRPAPLRRMQPGDWLVYYSPGTTLHGGQPLRAFTALGRVTGADVVRFDMGGGFMPWRRDVRYFDTRVVVLEAIRARLSFVRDNPSWGWLARRGHFEIGLADVTVIAS